MKTNKSSFAFQLDPACSSVKTRNVLGRSFYTPRFNEVDRGVYWYHLVRLSVRPCLREHMHWLLFVYIEHQLDTFCLLDIPNNPVCWTCLYWLLKSHYAKYPFGHGCSPCVREMAVHPLPTVLIAHSKVFPLVASWPVRNGCLVNRHRGEIFHYHGHVISHSETTRC